MKTTTKLAGLLAVLFLFFSGIFNESSAQCGTIKNALTCPVRVKVEIYHNADCNFCSVTPMTIPAGGGVTISCGACGVICNVVVTVIGIGGTPLGTPVSVDYNTISQPLPALCGATFIDYDPTTDTFLIH